MDGTFVKELAERVASPGTTPGGISAIPPGWTLHDEHASIKAGPTAAAVKVATLGALLEYVRANRDALPLDKLVAHVATPQIVRILGPIRERARDREVFLEANASNLLDNFAGRFMAQEEFIIGLQTRFENAKDRATVLALASSMTTEAVHTSSDDGIGQTVTAKAGVALKATVPVPNPVTLRPFRTFREVTQPDSLFVLRVNPSMQLGLFEADGGAWQLEAINSVAAFVVNRLSMAEVHVAVLA